MLRERILMYGNAGTGKTQGWLSIAAQYPESQFFVADTDDSAERMLATDFSELTNVDVELANDWETFDGALKRFNKTIRNMKEPKRREDLPWVVVDMSDATWDFVQNYFTEQVFNKGIDDFFLQARKVFKGGNKLDTFEGWTDWQVINKIFQTAWRPITTGASGHHLFITAKAKRAEGAEGKTLYKDLKFMPEGEKRMPHRVHTVLMSEVDRGGWYVSAAKDRGRELVRDLQVQNFAINYLVKQASWEG